MTPFMPLDSEIQWDLRRGIEASKDYVGVFGSASTYEAYLFIGLLKRLGTTNVLGAGCNEKEVEALVDSVQGPTLQVLVDSVAKDCGDSIVRRQFPRPHVT